MSRELATGPVHRMLVSLFTICLPFPLANSLVQYEKDMITEANWVIDGDTFNVTAGETIRLADINAPEYGEAGYAAAKSLLISLVYNKTVYLDIDDISRTDPYGRLVCVVFVDYNTTHVSNINKALLEEGVVTVWDHTDNEFNPSTWTLYVSKIMMVPEFSNVVVLVVLLASCSLLIIPIRRGRTLCGENKEDNLFNRGGVYIVASKESIVDTLRESRPSFVQIAQPSLMTLENAVQRHQEYDT